jgi:dipeptidase E
MRLLLGSGGFRTEERITFLVAQIKPLLAGIDRVLFIPYALKDHDRYVQSFAEKGLDAGFPLDGIHRHADPQQAVRQARAIYIGGGNTFRLLADLYRFDLLEPIRERVRAGIPYLGISAGSNVAGPTIKTTNDMPITMPPSLDALGLVPFQINPHYFNGDVFVKHGDDLTAHFGETRDERIREFHEMNDLPVIGCWEGGVLAIDDKHVRLAGAPARIFRKDQEPVDVAPGSALDDLLLG